MEHKQNCEGLEFLKFTRNGRHRYAHFRCSCGKNRSVRFPSCKTGSNTKHGMYDTPFYGVYRAIVDRCNYPSNRNYKNYGGRGIKCEWSSFVFFMEDMLESYNEHCEKYGQQETTIDRIDVNGNYCKENCRWVNYREQASNKTNNRYIEYNGRMETITEWGRITGIYRKTIARRLNVGWSIERSLTTPPATSYRKHVSDSHSPEGV